MPTFAAVFMLALAAPLLLAAAEPRPTAPEPELTVKIVDRTPKFMAFWKAAQARPDLDADARFKLWDELDGFAAVPPTPEGKAMKRALFDKAWPTYTKTIDRIAAGAAGMDPAPEPMLRRVAAVLQVARPVDVQVLVYAGMDDHNAFTFPAGPNRPGVALPADQDTRTRGPIMAHEMTHVVHITQGGLSGGWERSVGVTALSEGLAIHVARRLFPDRPAAEFIEYTPGWLKQAQARRRVILADVRDAARLSKSEDVARFTVLPGPSGLNREAYFAGQEVVAHMLGNGRTLAEISRIPEAQAPDAVIQAIDEMIGPKRV